MKRNTLVILSLAGLVACEWNSSSPKTDASVGPRTDGRPRVDGAVDDADVDGDVTTTEHLLLSEVALQPAGGEFIEIVNPTAAPISLADYYLSDNGDYWRLPAGAPNIGVSDFIIEFPATATIPAGGAITIATGTAAAFMTTRGVAPTYSITDSTVTRTVVPGAPTLTDAGEIVVLFHWDGTAGLVDDVDIMIAGVPTMANTLVSKSSATLGSAMYAADANTIQAQTATPGTNASTKRTMAEAGNETQAGAGNGITGDDETSENTRTTWDSTFTAATPGAAPTL